jgi:hypothetical protein
MKDSRQAVMRVSGELIRKLLPQGKAIDCLADKISNDLDYSWLHDALLLPKNSEITGVSVSIFFYRDEVAIRLRCSDFRETLEGCDMPEVGAEYCRVGDKSRFVRWTGIAVLESYKWKILDNVDGVVVPRTFEDWEKVLMNLQGPESRDNTEDDTSPIRFREFL